MTYLKNALAALPMLALAGTASAATNLSGPYTITVSAHPAQFNGKKLCATLVEDGSVLGYPNSGTFTLAQSNGVSTSGHWFTRNFAITFQAPYGDNGGYVVLSGELGKPAIKGTSYLLVIGNKPVSGGTFTAVKGCSTAE